MGYINLGKNFMSKPGRKGMHLSRPDLFQKITKGLNPVNINDPEHFSLSAVLLKNPRLARDLEKIQFSTENFDYKTGFLGHQLVGYHHIGDVLSFVGCDAGGDWEHPLFFIIYMDGKQLRGYIPTCGNTFNTIFKTAFFSESESPLPTAKFLQNLNDFDVKSQQDLLDNPDILANEYNRLYGTGGPVSDLQVHEESVLKDIRARFSIERSIQFE